MTIALNLTDPEAESIIEACKVLKGNPVLWLLSDRLESLLDMERDKQAKSANGAQLLEWSDNAARDAWQHHVTTARCQACNRALATAKLGTLCDRGKHLYQDIYGYM